MKCLNQKSQSHHKIALYIRVSTEEQASNPEGSIKSQEHRLRAHVDLKNMDGIFGEVTQVYIDRAKSGKDTKRSELQKLLAAIAAKEVTFVMVTEISRLSRSLKDFCQIWELMQRHGCQFQSLREQTLNPPVEFSDYKSLLQKIRHGLDGADDALKARIVTTLIRRIEILPASIRVHYRMGKGDFSIDLKGLKRSEGMVLEVPPPSGRHRGRSGSNTACNGGPTWNRTKN